MMGSPSIATSPIPSWTKTRSWHLPAKVAFRLQPHRIRSPSGVTPGDAKVKSWRDEYFSLASYSIML